MIHCILCIKKDQNNLQNIITAISNLINPFDDKIDKNALYNISTGKAASSEVTNFLLGVEWSQKEVNKN